MHRRVGGRGAGVTRDVRDTRWFAVGDRYERWITRHVPGDVEDIARLSCGDTGGDWWWCSVLADGSGGWLAPVRGWADTLEAAQAAADAAAGLPCG